MAIKELLLKCFADSIPLGIELLFYHISTPPAPTSPLFSAPAGQIGDRTFCETHFLAASLPAKGVVSEELLVFAIEVLVFTTQSLTTIFVSKADSTGYLHLLRDLQPGFPSLISTICTTFLSYLVKHGLQAPRLVLSLFARSQSQYLFPGSIANPGKHVLTDRQLIRWWARTLDPVLREYGPGTTTSYPDNTSGISSRAYIIVPGCDKLDTRAFFPPSVKTEQISRWSNSYPEDLIVPDSSAPPRCLIPRFPDDPKARFLDDLDAEVCDFERSSDGEWRSVRSLNQFWEMMAYRQECSAGRLVGFLWVVFTLPDQEKKLNAPPMDGHLSCPGQLSQVIGQFPTPHQSQMNTFDPLLLTLSSDDDVSERIGAAPPPPSSLLSTSTDGSDGLPGDEQDERPQHSRRNKLAACSKLDSQNLDGLFYDDAKTAAVRWPSASRGHLLIPESTYQLLMNHLLESDFANQHLTARSTSSWISKASELAGTSDWGRSVTGRKPVAPPVRLNGAENNMTVNVLTGIRKKRKVVDSGGDGTEVAAINGDETIPTSEAATLPRGLPRKKHKAGGS